MRPQSNARLGCATKSFSAPLQSSMAASLGRKSSMIRSTLVHADQDICAHSEILDELHDAGKQVGRSHDLFLDMFTTVSGGMALRNVSEDNEPEVLDNNPELKAM